MKKAAMAYISIPAKGSEPACEGAVLVEEIVAVEPKYRSSVDPSLSTAMIHLRCGLKLTAHEDPALVAIRWIDILTEDVRLASPWTRTAPEGRPSGE